MRRTANRPHLNSESVGPPGPAGSFASRAAQLERENTAALAQLQWQAHLKRCRACRLGQMGGIYGMCERGRRLNYANDFARERARAT